MTYRAILHSAAPRLGISICLLALGGCADKSDSAQLLVSALTRRPPSARIAAGNTHSLALTSDGRVLSWGNNTQGQLGRLTSDPASSGVNGPAAVNLSDLIAVAAGADSTYALQVDGRLYAMGADASGQLGDGVPPPWDPSVSPLQVLLPGGTNVAAVVAGGRHAMALTTDGTVYGWGRDVEGQLGDLLFTNRNIPQIVVRLDSKVALQQVVAIAAGGTHTLAITQEGKLWGWGNNQSGQVDARRRDVITHKPMKAVPAAVPIELDCDGNAITEIIAIAAGEEHSLALNARGQLWAWGSNSSGECGIGGTPKLNDKVGCPTRVTLPLGTMIKQLVAGSAFSLALLADGTLFVWGNNGQGRLGLALATTVVPLPQSSAISGVTLTEVAAGARHVLATDSRGQLYGWGDNGNLQLRGIKMPTLPPGVLGVPFITTRLKVRQLTASYHHSLILTYDGLVYGAGYNMQSQLGDGGTLTPAQWNGTVILDSMGVKSPLNDVLAIATGAQHGLALLGDGTVLPWGDNSFGQLGLAAVSPPSPPPASLPCPQWNAKAEFAGLGQVVAVSAGSGHSLALLGNGRLYSFGLNSSGQLGLGAGSTTNAWTPQLVLSTPTASLSQHVIQAAAGEEFSLALLGDGSVYSWGLDTNGQLGQGTRTPATNYSGQPGQVHGPAGTALLGGIVSIAACASHALALSADGVVYAWGNNVHGQLGQDGLALPETNLPVVVSFSPPRLMRAIACGTEHSLAITSTGELWSWGLNMDKQLGRSTAKDTDFTPQPVETGAGITLQQVVGVSAGSGHTLALTTSGNLLAFGRNLNGEFGDKRATAGFIPQSITTLP